MQHPRRQRLSAEPVAAFAAKSDTPVDVYAVSNGGSMEELKSEPAEEERTPKLTVPRVALVAPGRNHGLSTLVTGILGALRKKQLSVAILKLGAPLEQLAQYRRLSGRLCYTLHPWNVPRGFDPRPLLVRVSAGAELLVIEGDEGLFDRLPAGYGVSTTSELLAALRVPTIIVVKGGDLRESIVPMVAGLADYDRNLDVRGVIIVNSTPAALESQRRALLDLEERSGPALIGIVPRASADLVDYHSDLPDGAGISRPRLMATVEHIEKCLSLDKLRQVAQTAPVLDFQKELLATKSRICRVAVADDAALHTMFQENLDLLRREGAELAAFSPMSDQKLPPNVRAVYLPGGPLERHAATLSANSAMRDELRVFAQSGGVIYAEGAGMSYLSKSVTLQNGEVHEMTGIIPVHSSFLERFSRMGEEDSVIECRPVAPNFLLKSPAMLRGFRPSRWAFRVEGQTQLVFEAYSAEQVRASPQFLDDYPPLADGFMPRNNVLATAFLLNWETAPNTAENFLSAAMAKR